MSSSQHGRSDVTTETDQQVSETDFLGFVPHRQLLNCIHCGLCTSSCPTYLVTGNENNSPRGRIHLMRGVEEKRIELSGRVREHLDLCLDCRSCETACPSGVEYGQLIEQFRLSDRRNQLEQTGKGQNWFERIFLRDLFPHRRKLELVLWPVRVLQMMKLDWLIDKSGITRLLPMPLQRMQRMLPRLVRDQPKLPSVLPAQETEKARVGLFLGCVADVMFRHVHWACARVLQNAGCEVLVPNDQQCCGAMEYHTGQTESAIRRAIANVEAFGRLPVDVILVNVAGCGAMMKEYVHLEQTADLDNAQATQLKRFAGKVRDVTEYLAELDLAEPPGELPIRVVYQDACHLKHAQQVDQAPRELLRKIPGLELVEILEPNICCGAAGSYNLQQPEMSDELGNRKISHILAKNPDAIVSANAGCALQLMALLKQRGKQIPVFHPVELFDASQQEISWEELKSR